MSPEQLEGQNVDARSDLPPLKITEELSWRALSPDERWRLGIRAQLQRAARPGQHAGHLLASPDPPDRRSSLHLFIGMDTHALSEPAFATALEVLAANGVEVMIDRDRG